MYQIDYNEIEEDIFNCINECRNNPFNFITKLKEAMNYFKDKLYHHPCENAIMTYDGSEGVEEAIQYLKTLKPLHPLTYSEEISKACRDHIADIGPKGLTTHIGTDGTNITDRIEKYCEWDGMVAENLDFGFKLADNAIMNMIVDDGIKEKMQRNNIFHKDFNYIGVGAGPHKMYGICIVIGFATKIRELGTEPENDDTWTNKMNEELKKEEEIGMIRLPSNLDNPTNTTLYNSVNPIAINEFKFMEPDAPDNSISVSVSKKIKTINNQKKKITKKTFLLQNGINHIIEIAE